MKLDFPLPVPQMVFRRRNQRVFDAFQDQVKEPFLTSVIASNRMNDFSLSAINDVLNPMIDGNRFAKLKDIDRGSERLAKAIQSNERIGLVTDFDVDGITSAVVMYRALTEVMRVPVENVDVFINKRMEYSFGFNDGTLQEILTRNPDNIPTLLITADQGSNDTDRIAAYKQALIEKGIDFASVIVTDHHNIEQVSCPDADAFINPQRTDCEFGDKTICGCVVALCLMRVTLDLLLKEQWLTGPVPRLNFLMGYAGLATVADCVSLQTPMNRKIIHSCLNELNNSVFPAWQIFRRKYKKINVEHLAFLLAPKINADSRTGGDGMDSFRFLTADNLKDAEYYLDRLTDKNDVRKEINEEMLKDALRDASEQYYSGRRGLVVFLERGHHGIQGIVASKIKDQFNCPTIIVSPDNTDEKLGPDSLLKGSGRSVPNVNIINIIRYSVASEVPFEKFGGHHGAMGLSLKMQSLELLKESFDRHVKRIEEKDGIDFKLKVWIDHLFHGDTLKMINQPNATELVLPQLERLEPYGQMFERPVFAINAELISFRLFANNTHAHVYFRDSDGIIHKGVLFFVKRHHMWFDSLVLNEEYTFAFELGLDDYNGNNQLSYKLIFASPGVNAVVSG